MARRTQFALSPLNLYSLNLPGLRMYTNAQGWDATLKRPLGNLEVPLFADVANHACARAQPHLYR